MATKCAVVSTNVGRMQDFESDTVASIVPPSETEKLVEAVFVLINNPAKRERLQANGFEYVRRYTYEDAVDRFEKILEGSCGQNGAPP
jgi:glycosyltransferase involved in cell wall biosynthesis